MFNFAVINLKNIKKININIKAFIAIVTIFLLFFLMNRNIKQIGTKVNTQSYASHNIFQYCLDLVLPGFNNFTNENINENINKNVIKNEKEENITSERYSLLSSIITYELPEIIGYVDENDIEDEKKIDKQTEQKEKNYSINNIQENVSTEVVKSSVPETYTNILDDVNIKNGTDINLTNEMIIDNLEIKNTKNILIYHTHTCESYTPSEEFLYEMTGNFRTNDLNYSVARVGTEFEMYLKNLGFNVIHDTTYYDYPAYNGSYERAYDSIKNLIDKMGDMEILFDIHRDAIGDSTYAPTVKIGDEYAAQIMFVIGSNGGGLEHPNWLYNLSFAIKIQRRANEKYPGLFKPIILRNSRYNQHLAKGACIIEVGATGNTLEQCNCSMKYLADVLNDLF